MYLPKVGRKLKPEQDLGSLQTQSFLPSAWGEENASGLITQGLKDRPHRHKVERQGSNEAKVGGEDLRAPSRERRTVRGSQANICNTYNCAL